MTALLPAEPTVTARLHAILDQGIHEIRWLRGGVGDPWHEPTFSGLSYAVVGEVVNVGRDPNYDDYLYVETSDGMRYYVPEDREIHIERVKSNVIEFPVPTAASQVVEVPQQIIGRAQFEAVIGAAGSGKSYASREYITNHHDAVLTSSTGVSAVNLGDATTINSLLGYFDEDNLRDKIVSGRVQAHLRGLRGAGITRIILDEVSMISAQALDYLTYAIDQTNQDLDVLTEKEHPLGMTLVGDFCQLPPVKGDYAFQAGSWGRFAENVLKLEKIWRQSDPKFIEGLRAARRGDIDTMMAVFEPRIKLVTDGKFDGTTIFATNKEVDNWNGIKHQALPGKPVVWETTRWGQQKTEWKTHIPNHLGIKPGALVMILANEHNREEGNLVYSNGDLGHFLQYHEAIVIDPIEGTEEVVPMAAVRLMRTKEIVGVPYVVRKWEVPTGATGAKVAKMEVLGSIKYMPIKLAYASTVHKTQSVSLDMVQCVVTHKFFASPSMLYVALSRARTLEGVSIVGTPQLLRERCGVAKEVAEWL